MDAAHVKFQIDQVIRLDAWLVEIEANGRTVSSTHITQGLYYYILEAGERVVFHIVNEPVTDGEVCY